MEKKFVNYTIRVVMSNGNTMLEDNLNVVLKEDVTKHSSIGSKR